MTERWVCLNGNVIPESHAVVSVVDRGFMFGDGMFTTVRLHEGKCELLRRHLLRLKEQAEAFGFEYAPQTLEWLQELITRNQAETGTWRLKIILTAKREGHHSRVGNLIATLEPYLAKSMDPCSLCLFPYPVDRPTAHIKSLSYLDHFFVRDYAQKMGCQDAVTTNVHGYLLETGCSNVFWMDQGILWVPDFTLPYLKGVFLKALLHHVPIPHHFVKATLDQVPPSASMYICNALTHVRPVLSIGGRMFPRNSAWEDLLRKTARHALENDESLIV